MHTLVLKKSIVLAFAFAAFMSAAMHEGELELIVNSDRARSDGESLEKHIDLENPQAEPLIIITQECPICGQDFSQGNMRAMGNKLILSACTQNLPNSAEHAFHVSCIQQAYSRNGQCSLCRRVLDQDELETSAQRWSRKTCYYSKRIAQGIPYGLVVGSGVEIINFFGSSHYQQIMLPIFAAIHLLAEAIVCTSLRSEDMRAIPSAALAYSWPANLMGTFIAVMALSNATSENFKHVSKGLTTLGFGMGVDLIIAVGTTYIAFRGICYVPVHKRKSFITGVLGGILLGIAAGYGLTAVALAGI